MENASKALIIAGAILIAILLISVGIMVMNQINKPLDQASNEADSQAARIFNAKFEPYMGTQKSAQTVRQVLSIAKANGLPVMYWGEENNIGRENESDYYFLDEFIEKGSLYRIQCRSFSDNTTGKYDFLVIGKQNPSNPSLLVPFSEITQ